MLLGQLSTILVNMNMVKVQKDFSKAESSPRKNFVVSEIYFNAMPRELNLSQNSIARQKFLFKKFLSENTSNTHFGQMSTILVSLIVPEKDFRIFQV